MKTLAETHSTMCATVGTICNKMYVRRLNVVCKTLNTFYNEDISRNA